MSVRRNNHSFIRETPSVSRTKTSGDKSACVPTKTTYMGPNGIVTGVESTVCDNPESTVQDKLDKLSSRISVNSKTQKRNPELSSVIKSPRKVVTDLPLPNRVTKVTHIRDMSDAPVASGVPGVPTLSDDFLVKFLANFMISLNESSEAELIIGRFLLKSDDDETDYRDILSKFFTYDFDECKNKVSNLNRKDLIKQKFDKFSIVSETQVGDEIPASSETPTSSVTSTSRDKDQESQRTSDKNETSRRDSRDTRNERHERDSRDERSVEVSEKEIERKPIERVIRETRESRDKIRETRGSRDDIKIDESSRSRRT